MGRLLAALCLVVLIVCGLGSPARAQSVTFLNPGKSDEAFWVSVSRFMQAAAGDLGMSLEVLYAERDATRMLANARQVVARAQRPDYLMVVNEKQVALEIVRMCEGTGIHVFLLLNDLSPEQKDELRRLGGPNPVIGSLVPDNEAAGYLMATSLIAEGRSKGLVGQGGPSLIALGGDRATAAAIEREAGLRRALSEHPEVRLAQLVYGEWGQERARQQTDVLLARYPDARLVWAANDQMAFGAMEAAETHGLVPGRSALFSGLNNSVEALRARVSGRLSVLVAGHFSAGGWALVMLHDHHRGIDLDKVGGRDRREKLFTLLDEGQSRRFLQVFGDDKSPPLDFRRFSLADNPQSGPYHFSILPFLK